MKTNVATKEMETMSRNSFTYYGHTYHCIREFADHFGINYQTALIRFDNGYTPTEVIHGKTPLVSKYAKEMPKKISDFVKEPVFDKKEEVQKSSSQAFTFHGKVYNSVKEFADHFNVNYRTLLVRRANGYTLTEQINGPSKKRKAVNAEKRAKSIKESKGLEITYYGKTYPSFGDFVEHFGINYNTAIYRKNAGYTLSEIVHGKKKNTKKGVKNISEKKIKAYTVDGKHFNSLKDVANYIGITYETFKQKLKKMSFEEAVAPKYTVCGRKFRNLKDVAKHFKVDYEKMVNRKKYDKCFANSSYTTVIKSLKYPEYEAACRKNYAFRCHNNAMVDEYAYSTASAPQSWY